jgi:N6-L-threonylcarbamoyladenine synthase
VIVEVLLKKLTRAASEYGIHDIAIAGGVSANSKLRTALQTKAAELGWRVFVPKFEYCTDNAAMVAITGYFKYLKGDFGSQEDSVYARSGGRNIEH